MQAALSTVSFRPACELAIVTVIFVTKLAVTDAAAFSVTFCGVGVPVSAPVKLEN